MPIYVQVILGLAAVLTALSVIWRRAVKPIFNLAQDAVIAAPIMRELIEAFGGNPNALVVLAEIAAEFRTDHGSSLRDVVNRLTEALSTQAVASEAARQLSAEDRLILARVLVALNTLEADGRLATSERAGIASDLLMAQGKVDEVAASLVRSENRADAVSDGDPGAAADAGAQSGNLPQQDT